MKNKRRVVIAAARGNQQTGLGRVPHGFFHPANVTPSRKARGENIREVRSRWQKAGAVDFDLVYFKGDGRGRAQAEGADIAGRIEFDVNDGFGVLGFFRYGRAPYGKTIGREVESVVDEQLKRAQKVVLEGGRGRGMDRIARIEAKAIDAEAGP